MEFEYRFTSTTRSVRQGTHGGWASGSCDAQGPEAQTLRRMEGIVKFLVDVFDGTGEAVAIRYVPVPCHSA